MKIKFLGKNGYPHQVPDAIKLGLVVDEWYTLTSMDVGRSSSTLELQEFSNKHFNTVMFEASEEDQDEYDEMFNDSFEQNYGGFY